MRKLIALLLILLLPVASQAWASDRGVLRAMSLEQKLGQMFVVFFEGPDLSPELGEMIRDYHVGGIILYSISGNIESPDQVARLTGEAQKAATDAGGPGLIVAVDQEGGPVTRLTDGFTWFPPNMAAAAAGPEAVKTKERVTAAELKAVGVNMNFAPVADVNVNPDNPIIGVRSYGSNPASVSRMAALAVSEYEKARVSSCAKHFPGHGDTGFDSHIRMPVVPHDRARLERVELAPFRAAIKAGVPAIMTAHVAVPELTEEPGLPATMSKNILEGLLRGEMGYGGLIVTDSLGMGALDKRFGMAESAERAFAAGANVLLFGADKGHTPAEQKAVFEHLLAKLKSGELSKARLDESVARIIKFKRKYGILEPLPADPEKAPGLTGTPEHLDAALTLARQSVTLIRDKAKLLPVRPGQRLMVIRFGPKTELPPVLADALVVSLPLDPGPGEIKIGLATARNADRVLVLARDARSRPGQAELISRLRGSKLILALAGAPYDAALFPDADCVIALYSDVPASLAALSGVIYGERPASGKLPVSIPGLP